MFFFEGRRNLGSVWIFENLGSAVEESVDYLRLPRGSAITDAVSCDGPRPFRRLLLHRSWHFAVLLPTAKSQ